MMEGILITARLKSTRLPWKVLLEVKGKPLIEYQLERIYANVNNIQIILCTSTNQQDDPLIEWAEKMQIKYFRGSEEDVLQRYYDTCNLFNLDRFYILYGDEPFTDIGTLMETFNYLECNNKIFVDNSEMPDGTFGYGMTYETIKYINQVKTTNVTEVWGKMVSNLDICVIKKKASEIYKNYRFTIDYPEDLVVFETIIGEIGQKFKTVSIEELINIYDFKQLKSINGSKIIEYNKRIEEQGNIL